MYELVAIPAWSIVELLWLAPTFIFDGPWETTSSPATLANRTNSETKMLIPGIIMLTRAELDDLENSGANDE